MAYEAGGIDLTFKLGGTVVQYRCVELASGTITECNAVTDNCIGVAQEGGSSGAYAAVRVSGVTKVMAGGVIAQGARCCLSTGGKVVTTEGVETMQLGIALEASGADGDIISMLIDRSYTVS